MKLSPRPAVFKSTSHEIIACTILCMAQFISVGVSNQALALMNIVSRSFGSADASDATWFTAAFALVVSTFIIASGKLGDIYGLKKCFILGYVWITVWSIITGVSVYANSTIFFIVCRAFLGLGFSVILPNGIGLLGISYPPGSRKNLWFGILGASAPVGASLSCIISGAIGEYWHWSWCFYILGITAAVLSVGAYFYLPNVIAETHESSAKMDWYGAATGIAGLLLICIAWNQAPLVGWEHEAYVLVIFAIGVVLLAVFFYLEIKVIQFPLLPKEVMNLHTGLTLLGVGLGWGSFGVWTFYYWAFLLNLRGYGETLTGVTYVPLMIFGVVAALTVSYLISRTNPSLLIFGSSWAFLVGILMLALTPVHQTYYLMLMIQMIPLSFGMDMSFPSSSIVLSNHLPRHHQGMAGSLLTTITNYSMGLSLGIAATVERYVAKGDTHYERLESGYRGAMWTGVGLASAGVIVSGILLVLSYVNNVSSSEKGNNNTNEDDKIYTDSSQDKDIDGVNMEASNDPVAPNASEKV
ncbi:hypothetical protein BABINDRAFT_160522 [Babjeviella inositovora NRRL Y-12698]|uniref:Major facilitator superfamily (MFS) profile domain-containing protein n=1 Tax=Babjeviella inositovora NRRL Y-12698 TaxID=984486 RepID=A0A1E3QTY5_9ASCO|nr:uncharacterized protein BABINDRAFT_160522 [Babjeviella inositovora NRRL Y-12698]ODQ81119.1 hypothetical protein BABINDRAFT_160522 [Babjeviella inositovora NRRL Y-12698]